MRMYSPEWEAIRDFEYTPRFEDVSFDLVGNEIPVDHGQALFDALAELLPWLRDDPAAGVHPIHGAPTGRNANLVINHRVKLVLRLPVERLDDARALCGQCIETGAGEMVIGDLKRKKLTPFATLYSQIVDLATSDEVAFMEAARAELERMGVQCGLIPGKQRRIQLAEGEVTGYSLMLHDISLEQSLLVQEEGLGCHHGFGCGIFIPHKSIKAVAVS